MTTSSTLKMRGRTRSRHHHNRGSPKSRNPELSNSNSVPPKPKCRTRSIRSSARCQKSPATGLCTKKPKYVDLVVVDRELDRGDVEVDQRYWERDSVMGRSNGWVTIGWILGLGWRMEWVYCQMVLCVLKVYLDIAPGDDTKLFRAFISWPAVALELRGSLTVRHTI